MGIQIRGTDDNISASDGSLTIDGVNFSTLQVNGQNLPTAGPLSNRNLIINGAMQVAQRGTSVAVSDNSNEGYQSLDRYGFFFGSTHGGACTISQSTTVPDNQGFTNSYKVDVTTNSSPTANQSTGIYTKIEAQDVANSGWNFTSTSSFVTLSFWARSTLGGTYCVFLDSDDAATYERYIHEYTLTADTWTKVEVQVPGKSTLAYNNDNGVGTSITWVLSAGSNRNLATNDTWQTGDNQSTSNQVNLFNSTSNDFYLTGVQLEVGSVATPFEHRSYGQELSLCQRYYWRTSGIGDSFLPTTSDSRPRMSTSLPVEMRIAPTAAATSWSLFTTTTFMTGYYSSTSNTTLPTITCNAEL
jgi:hypothetical protein